MSLLGGLKRLKKSFFDCNEESFVLCEDFKGNFQLKEFQMHSQSSLTLKYGKFRLTTPHPPKKPLHNAEGDTK